jgi:hypothetical protein
MADLIFWIASLSNTDLPAVMINLSGAGTLKYGVARERWEARKSCSFVLATVLGCCNGNLNLPEAAWR